MFKTDAIQGEKYNILDSWNEISVSKAIELANIDLPVDYVKFYTSDEEVNIDSQYLEFSEVHSQVLAILSNIPVDLCAQFEHQSLSSLYNKYLMSFHLGVITNTYPPIEVKKCFEIDGTVYHLPKSDTINNVTAPFNRFTAQQFCDALDQAQAERLSFNILLAVMCQERGETYTEQNALNRIEIMLQAPFDIAINCMNELSKCISFISDHYKWVFSAESSEAKVKTAFKRSGLEHFGAVSWIYEVAESCLCGTVKDVQHMKLYDFISILSYIRCKDKFIKYASK